MNDPNFFGLLREVTHDGFTASEFLLTCLTLVVLILAVGRMLPRRTHDATLPGHPESLGLRGCRHARRPGGRGVGPAKVDIRRGDRS